MYVQFDKQVQQASDVQKLVTCHKEQKDKRFVYKLSLCILNLYNSANLN